MCADQWDKSDADVACRMMGFDGSISSSFVIQKSIDTEQAALIDKVKCVGNESSVLACTHDKQGSHQGCANSKMARVVCTEKQGD